MRELLNTLFVTTERAYLHLDHDTIRMEVGQEKRMQMPLLHLGAIVCFGDIMLSPALMRRCAEDGRAVILLDDLGRFRARVEGPTSGNVLLRRAQHLALSNEAATWGIARNCVAGKLQNARQSLLRGARDAAAEDDKARLLQTASGLATGLERVEHCASVESLRGYEGDAARAYFAVFDALVRPADREPFRMQGRTRRPPLDCMNATLSFLYTLLLGDCVAAAEGVGLDSQVGYLHVLRSGRPALGLDLMEELRPVLADRLALGLINRHQLAASDFTEHSGGAVYLNDVGRKTVITAYQKRKQEEVLHKVLGKKVPLGLVCHVQARLLARHLRGDLPDYLPFLYK